MEIKEIEDKSGHKLKFKIYDGVNFHFHLPGNVEHHLRDIGNIEYDADDAIVLSYPKSGTHWVMEVVHMLKLGGAVYKEDKPLSLEYYTVDMIKNVGFPRVYLSHLFPRHLPKKFLDRRGRIFYVYRNPKDVSVSMYNFLQKLKLIQYGGKWEDFFDLFLKKEAFNSWFTHAKHVAQFIKENPDYPILVVCYEDMKKDLKKEVRKIAAFLQSDISDDMCREIAEKCQFGALEQEKNVNINKRDKELSGTDKNIFYRKGNVGEWKNWYTVAMNEAFDKLFDKEMAGFELDVKFSI